MYLSETKATNTNSTKLDESRTLNDCFRGLIQYNTFTDNILDFRIRIKEVLFQKYFNLVFGFFNNAEVTYFHNPLQEKLKDRLALKITRDQITIVSSIDCFKRTDFIVKTFDNKTRIASSSRVVSDWIRIFAKDANEISSFINQEKTKDLYFESRFNFYDSSKNFTFENKVYNDLYMDYNATNQLYCTVCYMDIKNLCYNYLSNRINRQVEKPVPIDNTTNTTDKNNTINNTTDNNGSNTNPNPNPKPDPNDKNKNNTINNTTDNNGSNINPNPNPKPDPIDKNKNNTINNTTDNSTNNIDIPRSLDIIINPLRNDTYIIGNYTDKSQDEKKKELQDLVDILKNDTSNKSKSDQKEIMQTTVTINNLIANTNCSAFSNKEDCTEKLKETQKAVVAKVAEILDCKEIFKTIFGVENPTEKMLFSALTIYYSTANSAYFESDNMMKMKNVTSCFVENSPDFLTKISNNTENKTNLEIIKNDYLNILTSTSSNLITISKANSQDIVKSNSRNVSIISNNSRTNLYDDVVLL